MTRSRKTPADSTAPCAALAVGDCPALKRYAEGWCEGKYFCIQVAETETLQQLKKHFRETVGHDRIQVRRWYHA